MLKEILENKLLSISKSIDNNPPFVEDALVLGMDFLKAKENGKLTDYLEFLGFAHKGELWVRNNEKYENSFDESKYGYMTIGELNLWRKELLNRCIVHPIPIRLSHFDGHEQTNEVLEFCLDNLFHVPGLPILFSARGGTKEQAGVYLAIGALSWPKVWRIFLEEINRTAVDEKAAGEQAREAIELMGESMREPEIRDLLSQLLIRVGENASAQEAENWEDQVIKLFDRF